MPTVSETVDVAPVWAGHPVPFALLTTDRHQYIGCYDEHRRMTFVQRNLGETTWRRLTPHLVEDRPRPRQDQTTTRVGWDSHNSIVMAIDAAGFLHASGNMHTDPLVYFRGTRPRDVMSLEFFPHMVGDHEKHVTYPRFFNGPDGALIFGYRDGSSGKGNDIYNRYDVKTQRWTRLHEHPLTDGQGKMNAYCIGPVVGPDGFYHMIWVWRDTPDAATNHHLSYARSRDLLHWEDSTGKPTPLPMTIDNAEVIDPTPAGGGMLNGLTHIGFDSKKRLVISYTKYDAEGHTQIYHARREKAGWTIVQATQWKHRWAFGGYGTLLTELGFSQVTPAPGGKLKQTYNHTKYGTGGWLLDEETLKPIGEFTPEPPLPAELMQPESSFPNLQVNVQRSGEYALRWESLPANRDKPHPQAPPPSMLRVMRVSP